MLKYGILMSYNFNINISLYRSAMDHTGRDITLAGFMRLGKEVYYGDIMAYRTLKASIAEQKMAKEAYIREINECDNYIHENANPFGGTDSDEVVLKQNQVVQLWKDVEHIEQTIEALSQEADKRKRKLPCATISGRFAPTRAKANLVEHSGFICIDIDDHVNYTDSYGNKCSAVQSLENIPDLLRQLPYVLYAAHSCGGVGYFALIPLGPIDDEHTHEWYFDSLKAEFEQMGVIIDRACRDTTRLRFVSYDENPIRNALAEPYTGVQRFVSYNERKEIERKLRENESKARMNDSYARNSGSDYEHAVICVEEIERKHLNYVEDYDMWVLVGCALSSGFGEQGRMLFHSISRQSAKYNASDCDKKYTSLMKRSGATTTIKTLFDIFEHPDKEQYKLVMEPLRWYEIVKNRRR